MTGGLKRVDWFVMLWGTILVATSADHTSEAWLYRSGIVWSEVGSYFLLRIFMQDLDDVERTFRILALGLAPLSLLILMQKSTGTNPFAALGGVSEFAAIRDGNIRANGPFSHAILAGTVGAVYLESASHCGRVRGPSRWPPARPVPRSSTPALPAVRC